MQLRILIFVNCIGRIVKGSVFYTALHRLCIARIQYVRRISNTCSCPNGMTKIADNTPLFIIQWKVYISTAVSNRKVTAHTRFYISLLRLPLCSFLPQIIKGLKERILPRIGMGGTTPHLEYLRMTGAAGNWTEELTFFDFTRDGNRFIDNICRFLSKRKFPRGRPFPGVACEGHITSKIQTQYYGECIFRV